MDPRHWLRKHFSVITILLVLAASSSSFAAAPVYGYTVVARYPHSTSSYTEGFLYLNGMFYEGTGLVGRSQLMAIDPATGEVRQHVRLAGQYFGEGIVDFGPNLYQWTWQSNICFVYDRFTLAVVRQLHYTGEGWGMTRNNREIITSDGTATLRFRNPATFDVVRQIVVTDQGHAISQLNELEYIHGEIYANVWHSDRIARIDPRTGRVTSWIDLTGLLPASQKVDAESVLNGIAFDAEHDRIFVTGKQWPTIFEIKIVPR